MAKNNYFKDMEQRYNNNGDNWIAGQTPQDIQKSARKRIFREMVNGAYDYEKVGKYFLDPKILENITLAASNEIDTYTLLYNAVGYYRQACPGYPNIGLELSHITNMLYIYSVIYNKLVQLKGTQNIAVLIDIAPMLYPYRNDINN